MIRSIVGVVQAFYSYNDFILPWKGKPSFSWNLHGWWNWFILAHMGWGGCAHLSHSTMNEAWTRPCWREFIPQKWTNTWWLDVHQPNTAQLMKLNPRLSHGGCALSTLCCPQESTGPEKPRKEAQSLGLEGSQTVSLKVNMTSTWELLMSRCPYM